MLEEETEHLARGIGPLRIGVRAGGAAACPGMASALDHPVLKDRLTSSVGMWRATVAPSAGCLALLRRRRGLQTGGSGTAGLGDDLVAIARIDGRVLVAMEHDRRHGPPLPPARPPEGWSGDRASALHGGERGGQILRSARGETGMHANRGIEIGIGRCHNGGRGPSSGEPGNIDPLRVDRVLAHDPAGDARDQRGLAAVTLLVLRLNQFQHLESWRRTPGPGRHEAAMLLGKRVHPRAGGEVVGRLGAAMQHDHQRQRLPVIAARHVELVVAAAGLIAVGSGEELGAVRQGVRCRHAGPANPPSPASRPLPLSRSRKLRSASGMGLGDACRSAARPVPMPVPNAFMAAEPPLFGDLERLRRQVDEA